MVSSALAQKSATVEDLQFRIEELERLLGMHPTWSARSRRRQACLCIVAALARRPGRLVFTKENILDLLYAGMPNQPDMKIIDVFICKARAKLTPLGIELTTIWGRGYMMDAANRLKLTELVERASLAWRSSRTGKATASSSPTRPPPTSSSIVPTSRTPACSGRAASMSIPRSSTPISASPTNWGRAARARRPRSSS
jgi:hypothetical protein